jgi:hypothetical protein
MEIIGYLNEKFWGSSGYFILLAISLIFILARKNTESRGKIMALYSVLILFGVIYNPVVAAVAAGRFMSEDVAAYMRIFYLLPLMSVIAYAITEYYAEQWADKGRREKVTAAVIICITIILSGQLYSKDMYVKADNIYKISQDALEISDIIQEDKTDDKARAVLPSDENICYGVRQYTDEIIVAGYTEEFDSNRSFKEYEESRDFSYVVIEKDSTMDSILEKNGYTRLGESDSYLVYKK